ncbi:helix-turn-helix domain-containing protein [Algoriphagus aquatilis]|uniref:Helix-turn-helix domain-containing protein n=1 Tax=Algoriphagus aquatilis TaxID=490186 RepID=A0ABW0BVE4_9BACT
MNKLILTSQEELIEIIQKTVEEAVKNSSPVVLKSGQGETLLSRKETADKLKISLVTLNDWTKRGMIQSYIIGGRVLYKESEIEKSLHQVRTVKY